MQHSICYATFYYAATFTENQAVRMAFIKNFRVANTATAQRLQKGDYVIKRCVLVLGENPIKIIITESETAL